MTLAGQLAKSAHVLVNPGSVNADAPDVAPEEVSAFGVSSEVGDAGSPGVNVGAIVGAGEAGSFPVAVPGAAGAAEGLGEVREVGASEGVGAAAPEEAGVEIREAAFFLSLTFLFACFR
jgi:hypothetical protein